MKKRIIKITMALVISISIFSGIGFFIHLKENHEAMKAVEESKDDIINIQEEYIAVLYNKILNEDTSKSLKENLSYYEDILEDKDDIKSKIDDMYKYMQDNNITDKKIYSYLGSAKAFLASVEKVYTLFKEGALDDFTNFNKLSDEEAKSLVKSIKQNYDMLLKDYEKLT